MIRKVKRRIATIELAGARVPSIMLLPERSTPVPAALLLHGYSSSKERLSDTMGRALAARGIASLAIDLPLHGTRDDAMITEARTNPLGLLQHWKKALAEAEHAITWLTRHEAIDPQRIAVAGYSLGSYIALQTAVADKRIASVIVAAGGDLPATPWTRIMRMVSNPLASAKSLRGRPLLMLHGTHDRTIQREQAQRLYDAASQPKEIRWYEAGHVLPPAAGEYAAAWLVRQFGLETRSMEGAV
jgi:predicted esterase